MGLESIYESIFEQFLCFLQWAVSIPVMTDE